MKVTGSKNSGSVRTTIFTTFGGLDLRRSGSPYSFISMTNMSSSGYPALSPRSKRAYLELEEEEGSEDKILGMTCADVMSDGVIRPNALITVTKNRIFAYYEVNGTLTRKLLTYISSTYADTSGKPKQLLVMGSVLYIFPDKRYINLMSATDHGFLESKTSLSTGAQDSDGSKFFYEVVAKGCTRDGDDLASGFSYVKLYRNKYKQNSEGGKGDFLGTVPIGSGFSSLDGITVSGFPLRNLNGSYSIETIAADNTYIVIPGTVGGTASGGAPVTIARTLPEMDYICSCKNRLWGCRYGNDAAGNPVNEIYACALGDAKNWNRYIGVSTDSYAASCGHSGAFTGAMSYDGRPLFFKEDCIIRVYGDYPAEFTVTESDMRGSQVGSEKSGAVVHDTLFYKTHSGIVMYNGGAPVNVDAALGETVYKNAVAGSCGGKYYVSMEDTNGIRSLFVYDVGLKLWHREDELSVQSFCRCGSNLYMLVSDTRIICVRADYASSIGTEEEAVYWSCESGRLDYSEPGKKHVRSLSLCAVLPPSSCMRLQVEYDGSGTWRDCAFLRGKSTVSSTVTLRPRRCSFFRYRLSGIGDCTLLSLAKQTETLSRKG